MNNKNRTIIFCRNKVKRAKKIVGKLKPPSYNTSKNDLQFSYVDNLSIPTIPPPPYESYEQYCQRTGKIPNNNQFDSYIITV